MMRRPMFRFHLSRPARVLPVAAIVSWMHRWSSRIVALLRLRSLFWPLLAIAVVTIAPIVMLHKLPEAGSYSLAVAIIVLSTVAVMQERLRAPAIAGATIPLAYLVAISLPQNSTLTQTAWIYGAIFLMTMAYRWMPLLGRPISPPPFATTHYIVTLPLAIVIGQILGVVAFGLLPHTLPFLGSDSVVVLATVVFACIEVIFFQGMLQPSNEGVVHPLVAAGFTAFVFTCVSTNWTVTNVITTAIIGSSLAALFYWKRSLVSVMVANIAAKLLFVGLVLAIGS